MTPLSLHILSHWRSNCPSMLTQLQRQNRLEEAIQQTAEQTMDMLGELIHHGMSYPAAWEMAIQEWAHLPTEARPSFSTSTLH
jgi:hypothetical protein